MRGRVRSRPRTRQATRSRAARREVLQQVAERQPRVDDVLDHQDVLVGYRSIEVLDDADDAGGRGRGSVGGDRHEIELARHGQLAGEVGNEQHGALEDAEQQNLPPRVVAGDLGANLRDALLDLLLGEQHLADLHRTSLAVNRSVSAFWGAASAAARRRRVGPVD